MTKQFAVVVPAAGVGKRMKSHCPKQYLTIDNLTILEHTVSRLLAHSQISLVVLALGEFDEYFSNTSLTSNSNVITVVGGKERVDSVLSGLRVIDKEKYPWVLVHDAARPCVSHEDISKLIGSCLTNDFGGLLGYEVRDTMKRSDQQQHVLATEPRDNLWHALTPQMYKTDQLTSAIEMGLSSSSGSNMITDESSAIELAGFKSILISASSDNIKITRPDDLALAEFILHKQKLDLVKENS